MRKKLLVLFGVILIATILILSPYYVFLTQTLKISPLKTLLSIDSLKVFDNQANILILGIPGDGYEGPNLSDTIIVANYNFKTNQLSTISIPRDIWSETLKDKINSAYAYGEAKQKGAGLILAKAEAAAVVGMPIQYGIVADFDQFKKLIDFLDGIDVSVENSFTDPKFPIKGKEADQCDDDSEYKCRYKTVSFKKGLTHMDGGTALIYVRSRHAEGGEGGDFAREKRQQQMIEAVKNKIFLVIKKGDLPQIEKLYQVIDNLIKRDITNQQLAIFIKNIVFKKKFSQKKVSLSEDFFTNPAEVDNFDGKWVLTPKDKDFSQIHQYINQGLKNQGIKN